MRLTDTQNHLLRGITGLSMKDDALSFAKEYLCTENLELHPDFLLIEKPEGKASIGVGDAAMIINRAALRPSLAQKHLVIIDGIDAMTEPAQNKLLKVLEDGENILILAISYGGKVLDTILSRMGIVEYRALNRDEFVSEMTKLYPEYDAKLYFPLTGGCINLVEELVSYDAMFLSVKEHFSNGDCKELFSDLHLVKEKDKDAVTENRALLPHLISFLQWQISEMALSASVNRSVLDCLAILNEHKARCVKSSYTKDDFFYLIMFLVEKLANGTLVK